jgi:hypothetical protein
MLRAAHIVGISKTAYVLATPRCLEWRHDLQRTSTNNDPSDSDSQDPCRRPAGRHRGGRRIARQPVASRARSSRTASLIRTTGLPSSTALPSRVPSSSTNQIPDRTKLLATSSLSRRSDDRGARGEAGRCRSRWHDRLFDERGSRCRPQPGSTQLSCACSCGRPQADACARRGRVRRRTSGWRSRALPGAPYRRQCDPEVRLRSGKLPDGWPPPTPLLTCRADAVDIGALRRRQPWLSARGAELDGLVPDLRQRPRHYELRPGDHGCLTTWVRPTPTARPRGTQRCQASGSVAGGRPLSLLVFSVPSEGTGHDDPSEGGPEDSPSRVLRSMPRPTRRPVDIVLTQCARLSPPTPSKCRSSRRGK